MTETSSAADRRPQHVALFGFFLQLVTFGVLLGISLWSKSHAIGAAARLALVGLPLWAGLYFVFKQITRVAAEALETAELQRVREAGAGSALFEVDNEEFLLERNRLHWMVRWLLPGVTVLLSVCLLVGHFAAWGWSLAEAFDDEGFTRTTRPTLMMGFVVGIGFFNFLFARYTIALARLPGWRLLHAGAVCMTGNAIACVLIAAALMMTTTLPWSEPLVGYVIRVGLLVLGVEFTLNFILDFYRPRVPGQIPRPSFDSRLLGLLSEPADIAKSIADAVNYQFGFEVSKTWFYQLLQRSLFPLMMFTLLTILALTSIVIVEADERVIVETWGKPVETSAEGLGPGIHLKWPYPVSVVNRTPARRINELVIGEATQTDDGDARKAILWTEAHDYVPELMLLVASPKLTQLSARGESGDGSGAASRRSESAAVSLLMMSVPIHYRIKDTWKYLYLYADPVKLLENVAYQYLTDYAAGVDLDELMGPGREEFNHRLGELIQKRLDELGVGIEIVFVGIRGAHPPAKEQVAAAYQKVVSAQTNMAATINAAEGFAQKILTAAAGTEARARALDEAIRARDRLQSHPTTPEEIVLAEERVNDLIMGNREKSLPPLGGRAASEIAHARVRAREFVSEASAKARTFGTQVVAYTAAPDLYKQRKVLELYEGMEFIRKYLIVGDPSNVIIEYETSEKAGLDRVLSEGLKERKTSGQ